MWGLRRVLIISSLIFIYYSFSLAQKYAYEKTIIKKNLDLDQEYLKLNYGKNKRLTSEHHFQTLYTLSYFNELKNTKIHFSEKKIKTTMLCRPRWDFIFRKKENRVYKIIFNSDSLNSAKVTFNTLSFNAQIGVIGHEYSHIIDYMNQSSFDLMLYGILYFTKKKFKEKLEKKVDKIAIDRGLGWQIYDFSRYVLNESSVDEEYKKYKATYYFTPVEINNILDLTYPTSNAALEN